MAAADAVASAVLLGFVLGMQHATDPDHLVAVGTIVAGERRLGRGALIGVLWGAGHTATLTLVGVAIIALDLTLPRAVGTGLELLVALMLVLLGLVRLAELARGLGTVEPGHLIADHEHGHREAFHGHEDLLHGARRHQHLHLHPSRRLLAALAGRQGRWAARSVLVGAVHGMAGSAAVALLVLTTVRSPWAAFLYLGAFGFGTMAGMTAFTAALAYPASRILRHARPGRVLAIGSGLGSIVFGLAYGLAAL